MTSVLQLEKNNKGSVSPNEAVLFNHILRNSGNFSYNSATGVILFSASGEYVIHWSVTQQAGLSAKGSSFELVFSSGVSYKGSSHEKTAQITGFASVYIASGEFLQLINVSPSRATFSNVTDIQAALMIYSINDCASDPGNGINPYIHAQVKEAQPSIADAQIIPFNNVLTAADGITLDATTKKFTISVPGVYLLNWEVPCRLLDYWGEMELTLYVANAIQAKFRSPLGSEQIAGSAIILGHDATLVTLNNTSGKAIYVYQTANITMTKISPLP